MRIIATFLFVLAFSGRIFAQLPDGSPAPNWTMTDLNNQSHTLFDYLDNGLGVIIDFSATWCGPCWNYHNTNAMKNLQIENGPGGSNEAFVFYIEGSAPTQDPCLYGPAGGCPNNTSTQGNWVLGTPYPIINDHSQNSAYQIAFFPTIFGVCPTNTVQSRKIYHLGQRNKNGLLDFIRGCSTIAVQVDKVDVDCFNNNNGSITIEAVSGVTPISYSWNTGSFDQTLTDLAPGIYTCTITDGNGSTLVRSVEVGGPTEPIAVSLTNLVPENCSGLNGLINIQPTGGNGAYTYFWSTGQTTRNLNQLRADTYTVTVTDNKGCFEIETFEVGRVPAPFAEANPLGLITCSNPLVTISGAGSSEGPEFSYFWTTQNGNMIGGQGTLYLEVDKAGTYTLQVSDDTHGCFTSVNVVVNADQTLPTANAGPDLNLPCGGGQRTLQGSGSQGQGFSVLWSTSNGNIVSGANTLNPLVNAPGTYTITILNSANGCSRSDVMIVGEGGDFSLNAQVESERCPGSSNGSATVQAVGAQGTVTYTWSNGANTQTVQNLSSGEYRVTVTDATGCSVVETITINPGAPIDATLIKQDESEEGAADGFVEVRSGIQNIVSYRWSNGAETARIENLAAGTYRVTVTDARGCTAIFSVLVENASCLLAVDIEEQSVRICSGSENGFAKLVLLNDRGEAAVTWSDGGQGLQRNDLSAGRYSITVVDDNNCPKTLEVNIDEFAPIIVTARDLPVFECAIESDERGIITVEAEGGEGGFSYRWLDGQIGNQATVGFGTHTVEVTDAQGCIQLRSFRTLSSDDEAPVAIGRQDTPNVSIGADGEVSIPAEWLDAGSFDNCAILTYEVKENPLTCDALGLTKVTLLVTDTNGNVGEAEVEVNVIDDIAPSFDCPRGIRRVSADPVIRFANPSAEDNCSVVLLEQVSGPVSGDEFPIGVVEVVFRAVDQSGNVSVCRFNIERVMPGRHVPVEEAPCSCPRLELLPFSPGAQSASRAAGESNVRGVALYPNPVSEMLNLEIQTQESEQLEFRIMNINGQVVMESRDRVLGTERRSINLGALPNGLYLAQVVLGDCIYTHRLIVQK